MNHPDVASIICVFNQLFKESEQTELIGGANEPVYLPVDYPHRQYAQIHFTHDYLSSALHEVAHWCVAGQARRTQMDYGYWYAPEGRNIEQQQAFYQVEIKPQALEWVFSNACSHPFHISCDNFLDDELSKQQELKFVESVKKQIKDYENNGLPMRAKMFSYALMDYYGSRCSLFSTSGG